MKSPEARLTKTYIFALMAVALTAIIGQIVIQSTLATSRLDAHAINLAGRQRMLSERIVKNALLSRNEKLTYADRLLAHESMLESMQLFGESHRAFRFGDSKLELEPVTSPVVVSMFDELDPLYQEFAKTSAAIDARANDSEIGGHLVVMADQQQRYVKLMNEIVGRMSSEAAAKVARSSMIEYALIGITILLLLFEGLCVFHPVVQQIRLSFAMVNKRETELLESERRHRDLFQYSAGPLLCLHPETGRIISANPAAAEALKSSTEELIGKRFNSFLSENSVKDFDDCLGKLGKTTQVESQFNITARGVKCVWAGRCTVYRSDNEQPYVLLSGHDISQQIEREQELILSNQRDGLTGLFCRAEFDLRIAEMAEAHQAVGTPFSLAMIDVDHFKRINDKYGHQAGDEALRQIASAVQNACRHADVVARYGGEELAVLFPSLNCEEAAGVAERIRASIAKLKIRLLGEANRGRYFDLTISIGIAGAPTHALDAADLVNAADDALYHSKNAGRNRVSVYMDANKRTPERRRRSAGTVAIAPIVVQTVPEYPATV